MGAAVGTSQPGRVTELLIMTLQRRSPLGLVSGIAVENLVLANQAPVDFTEPNFVAEFGRLGCLATLCLCCRTSDSTSASDDLCHQKYCQDHIFRVAWRQTSGWLRVYLPTMLNQFGGLSLRLSIPFRHEN